MSTSAALAGSARPLVTRLVSRRRAIAAVCFLIGVLILTSLGARVPSSATAVLSLNGPDAIRIPRLDVPVQAVNVVIGALAVGIAVLLWFRTTGRHAYAALSACLFLLTLAVVIWAARGSQINLEALVTGSFVDTLPLVFASMSGVICERSGVINIAIEGQLLTGAFLAAMIDSITNNLYVGLVAGAAGGLVLAVILVLVCLKFTADQIFAGFVLITLAQGLTSYLALQVMGPNLQLNSPGVFGNVGLPLLDRIPLVGPIVFNESVVFYLAAVVVVVLHLTLFRTRVGLRIRAVGEHPRAAEIAGINVLRLRYWTVCLGGVLGGFGGAALTIGGAGQFEPLMSSGLGFIGLAGMIFGRWRPVGAAGACLLFGFADSLQSHLAILHVSVPPSLLIMLPYVLTIAVVGGLAGRVRPPGADGVPYRRQ